MRGSSSSLPNGPGTQDQPQPSKNSDSDISNYAHSRRRTDRSLGSHNLYSQPVSPLFDLNQARMKRKSRSSQRSNVDKTKTTSAGSFSTQESNYPQNVSDWNEKILRDSRAGFVESPHRHAADPPRPPRDGFEWVWFPEGYWAEREWRDFTPKKQKKGHKWFKRDPESQVSNNSANKSASSGTPNIDRPLVRIGSRSLGPSPHDSQSAEDGVVDSFSQQSTNNVLRRCLTFVNPTYPHFTSPDGKPEGLYCMTKRNLSSRFIQRTNMVRL